jgi:hypothetical protein
MKLRELSRMFSPARWALIAVVAVSVLFALWWFWTEPGRANRRATEAKVDSALAGSTASSAKDAGKTIAGAQDREWTIDQQAQEAESAIRHAPEDQRNRVALDALCMSDSARNDPSCVGVRGSGSR